MSTRTYELPCYDERKSFYGKARVTEHNFPDTGASSAVLTSYSTNICFYNRDRHELVKLNPVATATTRRHIRSFFRHVGLSPLTNREWDALPLQTYLTLTDDGWKPSN